MEQKKNLPSFKLDPETPEQRRQEARIGPADIAEAVQRGNNLKSSGSLPDEDGLVVVVSSAKATAMLKAEKKTG